MQVKSVRLPREGGDGGRLRGFGYAEFETRQDLVDALTMNELVSFYILMFQECRLQIVIYSHR